MKPTQNIQLSLKGTDGNRVRSGYLALLFLLFSCSKNIEVEKCKSVIYLYDVYEKGILTHTDTSIVFPKVCGEELKRFESYSKEPMLVCGTGNFLRLIIK